MGDKNNRDSYLEDGLISFVLRTRITLYYFVGVTMAFDEATGIVIYGPEVFSRGFVFETETGHLLEDAVCVILEVVEDIPLGTPGRVSLIRTRMQTALRKYFDFTIHCHPIILPFFLEV